MAKGQVFPNIRTVQNKLVGTLKHFRIVVSRAEKDANPLTFLDGRTADFSIL
jgi:hypothetical protein